MCFDYFLASSPASAAACRSCGAKKSRQFVMGRGDALKPVRAEQVRRPEWKQNWTVPHCGSVLPICLSLRHVGSIHISCLAAREQTSAAQIAKASPPYEIFLFIFLAPSFNSIFIFLTEAAQYECSYRRTAHHATGKRTCHDVSWCRKLSPNLTPLGCTETTATDVVLRLDGQGISGCDSRADMLLMRLSYRWMIDTRHCRHGTPCRHADTTDRDCTYRVGQKVSCWHSANMSIKLRRGEKREHIRTATEKMIFFHVKYFIWQ